MTTPTDTHFWNRIGRHWLATMLLVSLTFAIGATEYSNAKPGSTPAGLFIKARSTDELEGMVFANIGMEPGHNKGSYLVLHIVPDSDGKAISVSAGGVGELGGTAFANIGIGPGHNKGSYTLTYSDTVRSYITTVSGFTSTMDDYGSISITTTLGLDSGLVDFYRAYVPASTGLTIGSVDGNLCLTLVSTDTFPSEAYVVVVPSYAPPGPPPLGHRLVGSAYSMRASGAMLVADRPMSLRLYYNPTTLAGADPHTLAILAWDAYHERWDNLGGTLFSTQQYVSVATRRFTTYALMATTTWRDEFDELSGVDFAQSSNVTWGGTLENRTLVLVSTRTDGSAISVPITPTTGFAAWDSLAFSRTIDPPTTTLTVDVLSLDGSTVLTDVASGTSLADLVDPAQYPSLRLWVNMSSTVRGKTPALERWQLAWQVEEYKVYLPIVLKLD